MNGDITVGVKSLADSRPLSFTSMNGRVTIRVPADAKAAVRFRTHHGVILTNFDDKALVTRTEISRHRAPKAPKASGPDKAPGGSGDEGPGQAPAAAPGRDSDDSQRSGSEGDWHDDVRESIRDAAEVAADAAREAAVALHEGLAEARVEISGVMPPNMPMPPLPPMTGGKIVSGTLNGGGVEIQAATLNGDIILKKAE
jgi:hypothetical protein